MIEGLKKLDKNTNKKVGVSLSIKYLYNFIQAFGNSLKYGLKLENIAFLWHHPHIFEFLVKPKQFPPKSELPVWRMKYNKRIHNDLIKDILTKLLVEDQYILPSEQFFTAIDDLFISYNLFIKSIEMTEKTTVRYKSLENIVGINFYFSFLVKLIKLRDYSLYGDLTMKVVKKIFQLHLRPYAYENIELRCDIWLKCLVKTIKIIHLGC